jgi:hypothetical protein
MTLRDWWRGAFGGARPARDLYRPAVDAPRLKDGIAVVRRRWPDVRSPSMDAPIFLLSAGWRSGSTLLQRQVMTSSDVLVWGEPYGHAAAIDRLAEPVRCMTDAWPHDDWFDVPAPVDPAARQSWTANLFPPVAALLAAHVRWFETLFAEPARAAGYPRWGLKEIRLTGDHAHYLRWVFPRARIVMLYRNPYHAYRSYRRWRSWYLRWPDDPVRGPARFGAHWRDAVTSFEAERAAVGAMVVRFEDLAEGRSETTAALTRHLDVATVPATTLARLDSRPRPERGERMLDAVPSDELAALRAVVDPVAARLGYLPDAA